MLLLSLNNREQVGGGCTCEFDHQDKMWHVLLWPSLNDADDGNKLLLALVTALPIDCATSCTDPVTAAAPTIAAALTLLLSLQACQ